MTKLKKPTPKDKKSGWAIRWDFIEEIRQTIDTLDMDFFNPLSEEEIETVLLALVDLGYLEFE